MKSVYEECPVLENDTFQIRRVNTSDAKDLVKVYRDKNALPFFNSDNCHGDNFYYSTEEIMTAVLKAWEKEYANRGFVRFVIIDKSKNAAIGTIELFHRDASDYFTNCGFLRVDVRSDYENHEMLSLILNLIVPPAYELFDCTMVATKAPIYAVERVQALRENGFEKTEECFVGQSDHRTYRDYWIKLEQKQ